jgi:hypothetical protein
LGHVVEIQTMLSRVLSGSFSSDEKSLDMEIGEGFEIMHGGRLWRVVRKSSSMPDLYLLETISAPIERTWEALPARSFRVVGFAL